MNAEVRAALVQVLPFFFALVMIGVAVSRGKITKDRIGWRRPDSWRATFGWLLLFVALALGFELLLLRLGLGAVAPWTYGLPAVPIRSVGILVLAPLVEEILLRGVLLSLLARRLNIYVAIVLQSLLFVVMHNPSFGGGIEAYPGILQLFGDGVLFGLARHHTGSLCAPVAMHAAGNMIAVLQRIA